MDTVRIAVCDDKENIAEIIFNAVKGAFGKNGLNAQIERYNTAELLWRAMQLRVFDLVFLDIGLPKMDGISLGEKLRSVGNRTDIIYVSAREDRVFDTFKVRPFDFVRKSNFLGDLFRVIDSYIDARIKKQSDVLVVQNKSGVMNLPLSNVVYFEGAGKIQLIHTEDLKEPIKVYRSIESIESELGGKGFIRIHKGLIVNYRYISRILVSDVELTTGELLPLSRRRACSIKEEYLGLLKSGGSVIL